MSRLTLPARVTVHVQVWRPNGPSPYRGPPLAFEIRTFARAKNDISLGPFFTDLDGRLSLTRRQLELSAASTYDSGGMDYVAIEEAFSFVEIVHYSPAAITRMIHSRETSWTMELRGEADLYGSLPSLIDQLRRCGNRQVAPPAEHSGRLRDEWTDPTREAEYVYSVIPVQSA